MFYYNRVYKVTKLVNWYLLIFSVIPGINAIMVVMDILGFIKKYNKQESFDYIDTIIKDFLENYND
jgi:hypothetical protein